MSPRALLALIAVILVAALAGCGGNSDSGTVGSGSEAFTVPSDVHGLYGELGAILDQLPYEAWYSKCVIAEVKKTLGPKQAEELEGLPEEERERKAVEVISGAGPACEARHHLPVIDVHASTKELDLLRAGFDGEQCLEVFDILSAYALDHHDLDTVFGTDDELELDPELAANPVDWLYIEARLWTARHRRQHPALVDRRVALRAKLQDAPTRSASGARSRRRSCLAGPRSAGVPRGSLRFHRRCASRPGGIPSPNADRAPARPPSGVRSPEDRK